VIAISAPLYYVVGPDNNILIRRIRLRFVNNLVAYLSFVKK